MSQKILINKIKQQFASYVQKCCKFKRKIFRHLEFLKNEYFEKVSSLESI